MRERDIEKHLVKRCKELRIWQRKFVSPGHRGVPDRILLYEGEVLFLELKAPGKHLRPLQQREISAIRHHRGSALWADNKEQVDRILETLIKQAGL